MKVRILYFTAILFCFNYAGFSRAIRLTTDTLHASKLKPFGRYSYTSHGELEMISSAIYFGFKFKGDQCALYVSINDVNGHNYIQYELDGVYQKRIRVNGNSGAPIVIQASGKGEHTVWIYKATEAHTGAVVVSKIAADKIKPLRLSKAPLIEFIGNSITCGAAADTADVPCGAGNYHDQHNAYMAYGPRLGRDLGMNYMLSSVSGIGIYRTWNSEGPAMPQVYENLDFQITNATKWNFKTYSPKIISIALGTNDLSNGDGKNERKPFDATVFTSRYVNFIKLIKSKYPKAQIVLLSSPMAKDDSRDLLQKCLTAIKGQIDTAYPSDRPIQTFFFAQMNAKGCTGHPSVEDHLVLANELKPFFQQLVK